VNLYCDEFERGTIGSGDGWGVSEINGGSIFIEPNHGCIGSSLVAISPLDNGGDRGARIARRFNANLTAKFLIDFDIFFDLMGQITGSGFGNIVSVGARTNSLDLGFVSFDIDKSGASLVGREVGPNIDLRIAAFPMKKWAHVSLEIHFATTGGKLVATVDGVERARLDDAKTLKGGANPDYYDLNVGAFTDADATPDMHVKFDNLVVRSL